MQNTSRFSHVHVHWKTQPNPRFSTLTTYFLRVPKCICFHSEQLKISHVKCIKHEVFQEVANKQEGSTGLLLTRFSTRSTQPCCTIYQSKFMNQLSSLLLTSNWALPQTAWQMGRKAIRTPCWGCFPELLSFSWLIMTKCSLHLENLTQ